MKRVGEILSSSIVLIVLRFVLAGIFTVAGLLKIHDPQAFADDIATFQVLPQFSISLFALMLPPLEIVMGLALAFGWNKSAATLGILLLSTVFAFALLQGIMRGLPIDCGCFGSETPSGLKNWLALVRDILLVAGSLLLYYQLERPTKN
jgi:putative oxidoreductase